MKPTEAEIKWCIEHRDWVNGLLEKRGGWEDYDYHAYPSRPSYYLLRGLPATINSEEPIWLPSVGDVLGMLEKEGLCLINPVNEKFDPWKHEAVEMVPTKEHPDHTILSVIQPGYKFRDKILRPAKVRVAIGPRVEEKMDDKDSESGENEED